MKNKIALITGVTGQDGSYLAELLIKKGYIVHGIVRRASTFNRERIEGFFNRDKYLMGGDNNNFFLHYGDLTDSSSLNKLLKKIQPNEVYNLGAQSHVAVSFDTPEYTTDTVALGTLRLLDAIHSNGLDCKFYQAGSSEMFGKIQENPQKETTPFYPRSPYGTSKVYAHWIVVNYRESYDMFASNGILFNHESPRRGENFVTRKITLGACAIKLGLQSELLLGNLDAKRDWGYAKDYVEAMWLMLQADEPEDFIIATGKTYSVRDFCKIVFNKLDLNFEEFVKVDKRYFRPSEVDILLGDASKAKAMLGWEPKVNINMLADIMIEADLKLLQNEKK